MKGSVSVIIINYNTTDLLVNCLRSLFYFNSECDLEVIVVDNNSTASPKRELAHEFPEVKLIECKDNLGFSRANNIGIREATGGNILLLNSDTIFIEPVLQKCVQYFRENSSKKIGVLGCKLLNADLSLQKSYHWSAATFKKIIQTNPFYIRLFKDKISQKEISQERQYHEGTNDIPWLSGAFLFMDRKTVAQNELMLDEDFFMYSEDVELCYRAHKKGLSVIYFPEVSIIHLGGGGTNVPLKRHAQMLLSEWLCIMKKYGKGGLLVYLLIWRINHCMDGFFYLKNNLLKKNRFTDRKQKIKRRAELTLFRKHFFTFMFRYRATPNSNPVFLKYNAE